VTSPKLSAAVTRRFLSFLNANLQAVFVVLTPIQNADLLVLQIWFSFALHIWVHLDLYICIHTYVSNVHDISNLPSCAVKTASLLLFIVSYLSLFLAIETHICFLYYISLTRTILIGIFKGRKKHVDVSHLNV